MNELDPEPRRFWRPRFGLRTMFAVVVIVAIPCAWAAYSLNWIRQRRALLSDQSANGAPRAVAEHDARAPAGLWLLGELGHRYLFVVPADAGVAGCLFPESQIEMVGGFDEP